MSNRRINTVEEAKKIFGEDSNSYFVAKECIERGGFVELSLSPGDREWFFRMWDHNSMFGFSCSLFVPLEFFYHLWGMVFTVPHLYHLEVREK